MAEDPRVEYLIGVYEEAAKFLAKKFNLLLDTSSSPRRLLILRQILDELGRLRGINTRWADKDLAEILEIAENEAQKAVAALREVRGHPLPLGATVNTAALRAISEHFLERMDGALQSIDSLSRRVWQSTALERSFPDLAQKVERGVAVSIAGAEHPLETRNKVADLLRKRFTSGIVTVRGTNGRDYHFPLQTYAELVARGTRARAMTDTVIRRAQEENHDLVRISSNPSKTRDYCDAYAGRVFSLTGATPGYPLYETIPNGGVPMHPRCRHTLSIYVTELHSEKENQVFSEVDDRFLMEEDTREERNRVVRDWWSAVKDGSAPISPGEIID